MKNPFSVEARGKIYVASIVASGAGLVATSVLTVLGQDGWLPVVAATVSAVSLVAGSLARENLSEGETSDYR